VTANRHVAGNDETHQARNGQVGVRKLHGFELVQEEGVARHPGHHVAAHDQEEVGKQQRAARQIAPLHIQQTLEEAGHRT